MVGSGWGTKKKKTKSQGKVILDERVTSLGQYPAEIVRSTLQNKLPTIEGCYHKVLKKFSTVKGTIRLKLMIKNDGKISKSSIQNSTVDNQSIEMCVRDVLEGLRLDKAKSGNMTIVIAKLKFR